MQQETLNSIHTELTIEHHQFGMDWQRAYSMALTESHAGAMAPKPMTFGTYSMFGNY